jgi:cold shock CspA family protein
VWEEISGGAEIIELGDASMNSRAYCGAFNFKGGDQQKKVGLLSGGERNRVHMAKLLKSGGNVLLLDEPTNDLDVETLRALEDALEDFAGCAVIISHDRFFLDRLCTHILAFEGEAHVEWFEGNFEDYEEDKKRRLGPDALEPKRVKYKKFVRSPDGGGKDVFVHISAVERSGLTGLADNQKVTYDLEAGRDGRESAVNLKPE